MAYYRPGFFIRKVFNPLAMATGMNGARRVTATGRTSGLPRSVPVTPVETAGGMYLVSVRGDADWVLNLRANSSVTVASRGSSRNFTAFEVPVEERDPIIAAYRAGANKAVEPYWQKSPGPGDHPVFRLDPA